MSQKSILNKSTNVLAKNLILSSVNNFIKEIKKSTTTREGKNNIFFNLKNLKKFLN